MTVSDSFNGNILLDGPIFEVFVLYNAECKARYAITFDVTLGLCCKFDTITHGTV